MMGDSSNNQLEIMQRINAMLENSLDLSNLTGEVAPKRNSYSGKLTLECLFSFLLLLISVYLPLTDTLSMSDLFAGFGSNGGPSGNQNVSQQQDDVLTSLLQKHQLNQALMQHQLEQQNLRSFGNSSSLFLNKVIVFCIMISFVVLCFCITHCLANIVFQNEGQSLNKLMPNTGNTSQTQRSMSLSLSQHRQSTASSGLGDSPISSGSSPSPAPSGQPRTTRSQSTGGFSSSMQPGIHSTPTSSCRPIRGTSLFRYVIRIICTDLLCYFSYVFLN